MTARTAQTMAVVAWAAAAPAATPTTPEPREACAEVSSAQRQEARASFEAGSHHLRDRRWADALERLEAAVRLDPGLALAFYGIGEARLALGQPKPALAAFLSCREAYRCLLATPEGRARAKALYEAEARDLRAEIDRVEAEEVARSRIKWREMNGEKVPSAGEMALRMHQMETRLADLQEAQRHAGAEPPAVAFALGNAYFQTGALVEAEREFRAALAARREWAEAHHNLAVALLAQGRLEEAEAEAGRAEATGDPDPRLREELQRRRAPEARP